MPGVVRSTSKSELTPRCWMMSCGMTVTDLGVLTSATVNLGEALSGMRLPVASTVSRVRTCSSAVSGVVLAWAAPTTPPQARATTNGCRAKLDRDVGVGFDIF